MWVADFTRCLTRGDSTIPIALASISLDSGWIGGNSIPREFDPSCPDIEGNGQI